ncbi:hypothetical protein [Nocardia sp. NPDC047654]
MLLIEDRALTWTPDADTPEWLRGNVFWWTKITAMPTKALRLEVSADSRR